MKKLNQDLETIEEKINLLDGIGNQFKDMYFIFGDLTFKKLSEGTFESKKLLKKKILELEM